MGVLSWILLAACMLWSALRFLPAGREAHMPTMPYMIALIRFLWIPYLVIAVWAGLVGSWWQCGVAVAGIVSILAMQVPYWTNMPRERWHHQRGTSHETASDDHRQTARSADASRPRTRRRRAAHLPSDDVELPLWQGERRRHHRGRAGTTHRCPRASGTQYGSHQAS